MSKQLAAMANDRGITERELRAEFKDILSVRTVGNTFANTHTQNTKQKNKKQKAKQKNAFADDCH